jgi:hypothetical protein
MPRARLGTISPQIIIVMELFRGIAALHAALSSLGSAGMVLISAVIFL